MKRILLVLTFGVLISIVFVNFQLNAADVSYDLLLGSPADSTITLCILADGDLEVFFEYGTSSGVYTQQTDTIAIDSGIPTEMVFSQLEPDTKYFYRTKYRELGEPDFSAGEEHTFHTQRSPGSSFVFVVEADPHYLDNDEEVWKAALVNMLADSPDFVIDLGDLFMTEKWGVDTYEGACQLCREVRGGFHSIIGHSIPLFLATGNHEAELGWKLDDVYPHFNIAVWATQARQQYYPCPVPGNFYSGATAMDPYLLQIRDSFYSFEWGDAFFVVLDPFWYTRTKPTVSGDCWDWTLGEEQYNWLQQTLAASNAAFKFVFIHHLVGGSHDGRGRGGMEWTFYFEWGGYNADDTRGFDTTRPGWPLPIQDILIANGVDIVFHGHDHMLVKQDLDYDEDEETDIIYLECPQPSKRNYDNTSKAEEFGYVNGDIMGNSGHIRVTVSPEEAIVEYVRAYHPDDENEEYVNGQVDYSFTILPKSTVGIEEDAGVAPVKLRLNQNYPNPFNQATRIEFNVVKSGFVNLNIYNLLGKRIKTLVSEHLSPGFKSVFWDGRDDSGNFVASGIYFYRIKAGDFSETKKLLLLK